MDLIPLEATPSQELDIQLDGQNCKLVIYQRGGYLYMDIYKDNKPLFYGVRCLTDMLANPYPRAEFDGYLAFTDIQEQCGTPNWRELGTRYILTYVTETEMSEGFD